MENALSETQESNQAKYRELADVSRDLLFEQQARFARADEKAARLHTAVTVVLGVSGFFIKWALEQAFPPDDFWELLMLSMASIAVFLLGRAWVSIFRVFRKSRHQFLRLDQSYLKFAREQTRINVNYFLAVRAAEAFEDLVRKTDQKHQLLERGHRDTMLGGVFLGATAIAFVAVRWSN